MTKREAAIVSAYTGVLIGDFDDFHAYAEEIMERSVCTHEFPYIMKELKEKSKKDFMSIKIDDNKPPEWLYHTTWEKCGEVDFDAIEKALGFRLFGWQKEYILDGCSYACRRTGKTTAMILQQLFAVNEEPIDFSIPAPSHRMAAIRYDYYQIWKKLYDAGIKTRPVFWNAIDKKKYEVKSKDVSARSKERTMIKMDLYRYAREAFSKYEAEHYTCSDCSQCRYDDINEVYYCKRSYVTIDKPNEMSACDDFEKEN